MTTKTVRADGADLVVAVEGDEGKPVLLLANSLAADHTMWDDQIATLTRTHRVVRYDARGHGGSSAPVPPYDFPALVADMVAVLDDVGARTADVLALSLGGMTALGLALEHPDRVGAMVVCDARADNPAPFVKSWDDRIAATRAGGMSSIVGGTLERWFTPAASAATRSRAEQMILDTDPAGYEGCAEALKTLDYLRRLREIAVPVLYVVGELDMGAPKEAMAAMAEATPHGRLVVLPGLAHVPNMEGPAAFNAAVAPFLVEAAAMR